MAKKEINIGVEGNDGTGDSVRESFNKVNENFNELYAIFGLGGQVSFTNLDDTPSSLLENSGKVVMVKPDATGVDFYELVSNAGTNDPTNPLNTISFSIEDNKLVIKNLKTLNEDSAPNFNFPLSAGSALAYTNATEELLHTVSGRQSLVDAWNSTHSQGVETDISEKNLIISKGVSNANFIDRQLPGNKVRIANESTDASEHVIDFTVISGFVYIQNHGFNSGVTGAPYVFNTTGVDPDNLTSDETYYVRFIDKDTLSLHPSEADAVDNTNTISPLNGDGTFTLTDAAYNDELYGFWLSNEALPRKSVVRRQGDNMEGALYLHDHPGALAGTGTPNSADDLQAATKLYVDSTSTSSFVNLFVSTKGNDDPASAPAGKHGRDFNYSFKTINAACAKAEKIMQAATYDVGPYVQTITHTAGAINSQVIALNLGPVGVNIDQIDAANTIQNNKTAISQYVISRINLQYPNFIYNEDTCTRDVGLILDSIGLDIQFGADANFLSVEAGKAYFSQPSGEIAVTEQYQQTLYGLIQAKTKTLEFVQAEIGTGVVYNSVADRFDDVISTIQNLVDDRDSTLPPAIIQGNKYKINISSGSAGFTDQSSTLNTDLIPGKVIRGITSGAIGRIVDYTRGSQIGQTYDSVNLDLLSAREFLVDEELEYGNLVKERQITILLETGIYYEQMPIKIPTNVSIKGDEFRRCIIRPAAGRSQSTWNTTWFFRNKTIDGLTTATEGTESADGSGYYGYHYLTDASDVNSPPKFNRDMDVFLMNDNTIIRNLTSQRHGGFMMVLDPTGQILTRSPYAQTNTSFSQSKNKKTFSGGMFIDGYSGNLEMTVTAINNAYSINVDSGSTGDSLMMRAPNTPCSFFIDGARYQVNAVTNWNQTAGTATLILDTNSNSGNGFSDPMDSTLPVIKLQTAGNRSMLANDYTQINDLGYGVLATNNALAELVSVFTYYCNTGYLSLNGSQIRSLTGNNSYGDFGMVAQGNDPDEKALDVSLLQDTVQPAKIYAVQTELTFGSSPTLDAGEVISQDQGANTVTGIVSFIVGNVVYLESTTGSFNTTDEVLDDSSTSIGIPATITGRNFTAQTGDLTLYVFDLNHYPMNASEIEIFHTAAGDLQDTYQPYDVVSVTQTEILAPADQCDSGSAIQRIIWRFDLTSGVGLGNDGVISDVTHGTVIVQRAKQNILLSGVNNATLTRPSTALVFDEQDDFGYRTIAISNTIVGSIATAGQSARVTTDDNFDYIDLLVDSTRAIVNANTIDAGWSGTLGNTQSDTHIAITKLSSTDSDRLLRVDTPTGPKMLFTWQGKVHQIESYIVESDGNGEYGIVTVSDVYSIDPDYSGAGIGKSVVSPRGDVISLKAGLAAGATGDITVNISTCRATSHDFLDIGTGGYNTTNYPDRIYGSSANLPVAAENSIDSTGNNVKAQVQERSRGRVFFATTDQDGFFRVGRFFTVDQGTGSVTFNASIVLTNIDGIGFKRGVRVNEFTPDDSFTNATGDAVPTQTAVEGYIDRRLGWNRTGVDTSSDLIGPGALPKDGSIPMTGNLIMGGPSSYGIYNLAYPRDGQLQDAATKGYVDDRIDESNELSELIDTAITSETVGDILIWNDNTSKWTNKAVSTSDVSVNYNTSTDTVTLDINSGVINNANIATNAAITQSKLSLDDATANTSAGISTKGISSFNSESFDITNGWVGIKTGGISNSKLVNSGVTLGSTNVSLGASVSSLSINITGNLTGNADTATSTTNAIITPTGTANNEYLISFVGNYTGAPASYTQGIRVDQSLKYNPSTNSLTGASNLVYNTGNQSISGVKTFNDNLLPKASVGADSGLILGSASNRWNTVYATTFNGTATKALYADLAENYLGDTNYEPGTVLVFGGEYEVTVTTRKGDHRAAGIVTTNPAHLMNSALEGNYVIGVALQGRVPCKVLGNVCKGDLLVTSAIPGFAVVNNQPFPGTIIGKSLEDKIDHGKGIIEVVVGRT